MWLEDGFEGLLGEDRKQALKEALKKEWISSPVYKLQPALQHMALTLVFTLLEM